MNTMSLRFDLRFVIVLLLIVIAFMLWLWQPWQDATPKRTISITGQAKVKAAPDEFIFSPVYQKSASTSKEAISKVSTVGNTTVAKLKELGLTSDELKTDVYSTPEYDPSVYEPVISDITGTYPEAVQFKIKQHTATYSITATVHNKDIAQKVLDYLSTTELTSAITPQSTFKTATTKKLESEARQEGLADAKQKAIDTTTGLGAKLGKVVSISEPNAITPLPYMREGVSASSSQDAISPTLETGVNEITYSITVVFAIK